MDPRALRTAFLVLRLFFAQFWLLQFATKVRDSESGVAALRNLGIWSAHVTEWFLKQTPLPAWVVRPYTLSLPWLELLLGSLLLFGLQTRRALTFSALLLVSLCTGMMLQQKHDVVANNLVFLLATLIALQLEPYNGWALDRLHPPRVAE
jgi:thiosulfate dehydrogenase [quinone] large subunit